MEQIEVSTWPAHLKQPGGFETKADRTINFRRKEQPGSIYSRQDDSGQQGDRTQEGDAAPSYVDSVKDLIRRNRFIEAIRSRSVYKESYTKDIGVEKNSSPTDKPVLLQAQLAQIPNPCPGTCMWIDDSPEYRLWLDTTFAPVSLTAPSTSLETTRHSVLAVFSKPGWGKSVLAKKLFLKFLDEDKRAFAVFCKKTPAGRPMASTIVASLIDVLLNHDIELRDRIPEEFLNYFDEQDVNENLSQPLEARKRKPIDQVKTHLGSSEQGMEDFTALWRIFRSIVGMIKGESPPIFVIDALDECEQPSKLIDALLNQEDPIRAKWLITMRETHYQSKRLRFGFNSTSIEFDSEIISQDIKLFLDTNIIASGYHEVLGKDLVNTLKEVLEAGSAGMFFTVANRFKKFLDAGLGDDGKFDWTPENLRRYLKDSTLEGYYRDMLYRVQDASADSREKAAAILSMLLAAPSGRGATLNNMHLRAAFACSKRELLNLSEFDFPENKDDEDLVLFAEQLCGSIIRSSQVDDETGKSISITHLTAYEFFEDQNKKRSALSSSTNILDQFLSKVDSKAGHALLARACLNFITLSDLPKFDAQNIFNYPLLSYSIFNLDMHVKGSEEYVQEYTDLLRGFLFSDTLDVFWFYRNLLLTDNRLPFPRPFALSAALSLVRLNLMNVICLVSRSEPDNKLYLFGKLLVIDAEVGGLTPLIIAVVEGMTEMVLSLLKLGASASLSSSEVSPLQLAVAANSSTIVSHLINFGALNNTDEDNKPSPPLFLSLGLPSSGIFETLLSAKSSLANSLNSDKETILHVAAQLGQLNFVQVIIQRRLIDVDCVTTGGDIGAGITPLMFAAAGESLEVVKYLIEWGADPDMCSPSGHNPLRCAADTGTLDILSFLLPRVKDMEAKCDGWSPLHVAASKGRGDIVEALIDANCNLDSMNDDLDSPLSIAIYNGHYSVALQLLSADAKPEFKNRLGETPLYLAARISNSDSMIERVKLVKKLLALAADPYASVNSSSCLHMAAYSGHMEIVRAIVDERVIRNHESWDIEELTALFGLTPLVAAISPSSNQMSTQKVEIAKYLLGEKVDITKIFKNGWTYLHYAVNYTKDESLFSDIKGRILAVKPSLLYVCTSTGNTVLSLAASNGFLFAVQDLLGQEFDTTFVDHSLLSPLFCASLSGSSETVKLLLDHKCYPDAQTTSGSKVLHSVVERCDSIDERLLLSSITIKEVELWGDGQEEQETMSYWKSSNRLVYTPLQLSLRFKKANNAMQLLRHGFSPKVVTNDGATALHWASKIDNTLLIPELLRKGADKDQLNDDGETPYSWALESRLTEMSRMLRPSKRLGWKSRRNLRKITTFAAGFSPDELRWCHGSGAELTSIDVYGQTPLLFAVYNDSSITVEYILNQMDPHVAKEYMNLPTALLGFTPANTASRGGRTSILKAMITNGKINLKQRDITGLTVFDHACRHRPTLVLLAAAYPADFLSWSRIPKVAKNLKQQLQIGYICELTNWFLSNELEFKKISLISSMRFAGFNALRLFLGLLQDTENWKTAVETYLLPRYNRTPAWDFYCDYCLSQMPKSSIEDDDILNPIKLCPVCIDMILCDSCAQRTKDENLNGCYQHDLIQFPSRGWFTRSVGKVNDIDEEGQSEREWWESMQKQYQEARNISLSSELPLISIDAHLKHLYPDDRRPVFSLCIPNHFESLFDHLNEFPADTWLLDDSGKTIAFRLLESSTSDEQAFEILEMLASHGASLLSYDSSKISTVRISCERDYCKSLSLLLEQFDPEFDDGNDPYASEAVRKMILNKWADALSFAVHRHFTWLTAGEFGWLKRFPAIGEDDENIVDMLLELGPLIDVGGQQNSWFPWLPFKQPECGMKPEVGKHFEKCSHMVGQTLLQSAAEGDEPRHGIESRHTTIENLGFEIADEEGRSSSPSSEDPSPGIWLTHAESFDIAESVFSFVGLGGVFPRGFGDAKLEYPNGPQAEVIISYKTTRSNYDLDFKNGLNIIAKGLLQAIFLAQRNQLCCDSFTIPHLVPDLLTDSGHRMIQFSTINLEEILEFTKKIENATQDSEPLNCREASHAASNIFRKCSFDLEDPHTDIDSEIDHICLALQFLSLSFAFFLRGYIYNGNIPVIAVPIFKFRLLGYSGKYPLQFQPREMACIGKMLNNSILAFDRVLPEDAVQRVVDKSCSLFYLHAVVQDIVELWGPATCLRSQQDSDKADQICSALYIRNGFLFLQKGTSHGVQMAHWRKTFDGDPSTLKEFSLCDTIIAGVGELHVNTGCRYQKDHDIWQEYYNANAFFPIDTTPAHDKISNRTKSLAIGGGMFVTTGANFGATRIRDEGDLYKSSLKNRWVEARDRDNIDWPNLIAILNGPHGLLWSACTGLAMRVPLRICVNRVFDFYISKLHNSSTGSDGETSWIEFEKNLKSALEGDPMATMEQGNQSFKAFWEEKWSKSEHLIRAVKTISTILSYLSHTGWETGTNRFKIAWPGERDAWAMVPIQCPDSSSRWLRILSETSVTAVFAVATRDCLVSGIFVGVPFSSRSKRTCRGYLAPDIGIAEENIRLKLLTTRVCRAPPSCQPVQPVLNEGNQSITYIFKIVAADATHLMNCKLVKDSRQNMYLCARNNFFQAGAARSYPTLVRMGMVADTLVYLKEVNGLQGRWKGIGICSSDEWEEQKKD